MALRHMGKMPMLRQSDFSNTLSYGFWFILALFLVILNGA
jgi:hypothetical protein